MQRPAKPRDTNSGPAGDGVDQLCVDAPGSDGEMMGGAGGLADVQSLLRLTLRTARNHSKTDSVLNRTLRSLE